MTTPAKRTYLHRLYLTIAIALALSTWPPYMWFVRFLRMIIFGNPRGLVRPGTGSDATRGEEPPCQS